MPWKLSYVVVVDDEDDGEDRGYGEDDRRRHEKLSFSYTRADLQSVLQFAGCKMNHTFMITRRVFETLEEKEQTQQSLRASAKECSTSSTTMLTIKTCKNSQNVKQSAVEIPECVEGDLPNKKGSFDLYKRQAMIRVKRKQFLDVVCSSLTEYHYVGPSQRADIVLASRIREKKDSVTILLCGTSGCGKSTLSSLLASRLGITTVVSTDSVRHMMRSFADEKENPLLWASTYHAGEHLDPSSVAQARSKKIDGQSTSTVPAIGPKIMAVEGYKAQSEMVIDSLDKLITAWEGHKESVIVEGVHLSLNFVMGLMRKHPSIIPFLIYIADEEKHLERFAVRAKYMTLDPNKNKYVKYISNIRTIQDYLCKRADKHLVPKVNNTNVDRSVASIHATIFSCLRKRKTRVSLYDMATNTVKVVSDEYHKQCDANSVSSKCMFKIIQRQGSSRRLMAIVNSDGSVSKAWPFASEDGSGDCQSNVTPVDASLYGPLQVGFSEPVNVQFGNFGMVSWLNSIEGSSNTSSISGSRADGDDSPRYSSCSSSPLHSEGHAKDLIEDDLVASESEEELFLDTEDSDSEETEELGKDELDGSVIESEEELDEDPCSHEMTGNNVFGEDMNHLSVKDKSERTVSRTPSSRRQERGPTAYDRSVSLPTMKTHSIRIKKAKTFKIPSNASTDTTN